MSNFMIDDTLFFFSVIFQNTYQLNFRIGVH